MPTYNLEIKQIVNYPRCRIYREFVQSLLNDRNIRTNGRTGLFHYTVLCSYANFRTSYQRIEGVSYTVYPGEWVCRLAELVKWFRLRTHSDALTILNELQECGVIHFSLIGRGNNIVKYSITNWAQFNTVLDYNCRCQKDTGFFFLPISTAAELVCLGKCSEMDALLDMWITAVYNDERVQGSFEGPVVYFRNGTGSPVTSYAELALRWGISKPTVCRLLNKLDERGYISLLNFSGRSGSVIYLKNYLSVMFQISDVPIDKEEIAMRLNVKIVLPDDAEAAAVPEPVGVSMPTITVSSTQMKSIVSKALEAIDLQRFPCALCKRIRCMLSPLYDCKGKIEAGSFKHSRPVFRLELFCKGNQPVSVFELMLSMADDKVIPPDRARDPKASQEQIVPQYCGNTEILRTGNHAEITRRQCEMNTHKPASLSPIRK